MLRFRDFYPEPMLKVYGWGDEKVLCFDMDEDLRRAPLVNDTPSSVAEATKNWIEFMMKHEHFPIVRQFVRLTTTNRYMITTSYTELSKIVPHLEQCHFILLDKPEKCRLVHANCLMSFYRPEATTQKVLEIAYVRNPENRKLLLLDGPNAKFYYSENYRYAFLPYPRPLMGENIKG